MAVTRIKNNQITDNTIEYTKIKPGTLVGSNFNPDITLNSNVSIIGNLSVTGTSSTVSSTNTYVNDPLVVFNNGYTGSLTGYDIGILVNRNLASLGGYGSVNTAWIWVEADGAFEAVVTTDTGGGITSINNSGFANVKVGNITVVGGITTGTIYGQMTGNAAFTYTTTTNFSTANAQITGGSVTDITGAATTFVATNFSSGNAQITSGNVQGLTYLNATNVSSGNIVGVLTGTASTANVALYGNVQASTTDATFYLPFTDRATTGNSASYVTSGLSFNPSTNNLTTTTFTGTFSGTASITSGSVTGITGAASYFTSTNFSSGNIVGVLTGTASTSNVALYENYTASTTNATFYPSFTDRSATGNSAAYVNSTLTYNPSTGIFGASALSATASTTSTSSSSGALVVTGGAGVGGNLYVGQNVVVTGNLTVQGDTTTLNVATLDVEDLNITVAKGAASAAAADGAGITVDGANATILYVNASDSWTFNRKIIGGVGYFANTQPSTATTEGALTVVGGVGIGGNLWAGGIEGTPIGTYTRSSVSSTYLYASTGFSTANAQITGGSITGATGAFNYLYVTNFSSGNAIISGGSVDGSEIGLHTPAAAIVTTLETNSWLKAHGNLVIDSDQVLVDATNAALVVTGNGGAAFGGNAYVGGTLNVGASSLTTALVNSSVAAVNAVGDFAQMYMLNTTSTGSADFSAYGDNGTDTGGWSDLGMTGSAFNDPNYTITKSNDGYVFVRPQSSFGGNLVLATSEQGTYNDIVIGVGSFDESSEVARFHGNATTSGYFALTQGTGATTTTTGALRVTGGVGVSEKGFFGGNLVAASTTDSTSTTTGSFLAAGGVGIAGNVFAGKAATFNSSQTAGMHFKVAGVNSTNLLWAKPGSYDQVMIGNTAAIGDFVGGAKLQINSTDSILLPVGTSAQRPGSTGGTDTTGMFRYNTTLNSIEYYGGSTPGWNTISTQFTVIADEQFNGDGITDEFTLSSSQTTNSCIISINGVIQIPTLAYAVTNGTTLTFTEAPADGDVIDVRKLTTTQTVTQIASDNGFNVMAAENTNGLEFYTGASAQDIQYTLNTEGAWVTKRANVAVSSANSATAIDSFAKATYRSAKYIIQATAAGKYQIMEALVIHDDTTATVVPYGIVQTNGNVGVLSVGISGGTLSVNFIAANANTNVRVSKEYMTI